MDNNISEPSINPQTRLRQPSTRQPHAPCFQDILCFYPQHKNLQTKAQQWVLKENNFLHPDRSISVKMILKVTKWMETICLQAFDFAESTFQVAVGILIHYLNQQNEQPAQLQLIGCCCVHLASKVREQKIVGIQCYQKCSMNIFTREQFIAKQIQVFSATQTINNHLTFQEIINFVSKTINVSPQQQEQIRQKSAFWMTDINCWTINRYQLVMKEILKQSDGKIPMENQLKQRQS